MCIIFLYPTNPLIVLFSHEQFIAVLFMFVYTYIVYKTPHFGN